jgi:hypothetical protein
VGADVQINSNIYTSSGGAVVIIARKLGDFGGNIFINPSVTNISATLIADGSLINGVNGSPRNWLSDPVELSDKNATSGRLTINGRLFSYNSR